MNNSNNLNNQLALITHRYITEYQHGLQPQVSAYIATYPQHAAEIIDFIAYYHAVEAPLQTDLDVPETPPLPSAPLLSLLSSSVLNQALRRLTTIQPAYSTRHVAEAHTQYDAADETSNT